MISVTACIIIVLVCCAATAFVCISIIKKPIINEVIEGNREIVYPSHAMEIREDFSFDFDDFKDIRSVPEYWEMQKLKMRERLFSSIPLEYIEEYESGGFSAFSNGRNTAIVTLKIRVLPVKK